MHRYRSHTCGDLRREHVGATARLSGWVHRVRDHGGLLFVDIRDHYGITQVVVDPDSDAFAEFEALRAESVVKIDGEVRARSDDTVNTSLPTGEVELYGRSVEILGPTEELPLPVFGEPDYPEETRLRYRFLDLRRETLHRRILLRSQVISSLRRRMETAGFVEFQTPVLTASSPEGARDFLVPSRVHSGRFYALPQAPQQYKQLAMMSGFDRYFQIAPCFRDEDPRADRSPGEFYQLDIEMAFVEQEDVLAAVEPVLAGLFQEFADGRQVDEPFPRLTYQDAMLRYGTDKPDLRNPLLLHDVTETFRGGGFRIFAEALERNGEARVRAIPSPGGGSRRFCDRINSWAQGEGQPGLAYILYREEEGKTVGAGPVAGNLGEERTETLRQQLSLNSGDSVFFTMADDAFAALARMQVGEALNMVEDSRFAFCWVVDYPMYETNDEGGIDFSHNPFSMPQGGLEALRTQPPLEVLGHQYDIVCNGVELSSGAIRNHRTDIMYEAFAIAGYDRKKVDESFSGMANALRFGAPPHGGIAPGIDRIVMLLAGAANLREVVMFPMSQQAEELMLGAPAAADPNHLRELGLKILPPV